MGPFSASDHMRSTSRECLGGDLLLIERLEMISLASDFEGILFGESMVLGGTAVKVGTLSMFRRPLSHLYSCLASLASYCNLVVASIFVEKHVFHSTTVQVYSSITMIDK